MRKTYCILFECSCNNMEPPQNGYILCKIVDGIHKCTPSCRQGYALADAPLEGFYTCVEGMWSPVAKPQCMRKNCFL